MNDNKELVELVDTTISNIRFDVITPDDYESASFVLKKSRRLLKIVDDKEKESTRPLNEGLKKVRDLFRPYKEKINSVITKLNTNMSVFRRRQEEEARKEQEKINAEAKPDDLFVPQAEPEIPQNTGVKIRKTYKFEVIDKAKIDVKYLIPDERTIQMLVTKLHEKAEDIVGTGSIRILFTETTY